MIYASTIANLNLNKLIENLQKSVVQKVKEGLDPENTVLIVNLQQIQNNENIKKITK